MSIPATACLCAGIIARMLDVGCPLMFSILIALIASMIVGALNALLVAKIAMTPLLTTLTMTVILVDNGPICACVAGDPRYLPDPKRLRRTQHCLIFNRGKGASSGEARKGVME